MKYHLSFIVIVTIMLSVVSCKNKEQNNTVLENERDSLLSINSQQQMLLDDMTKTMSDISTSLDTIAMHESMIIRRVDEEGNPLSKKELKAKISTLSEIIKKQREKMSHMEDAIAVGQSSMLQLKSIIAYLNVSLEQKEIEIEKLRKEINSKNFNIAQLNEHVSYLRDTVESVRQENEEQKQQLEKQTIQHEKAMNEVYYIIGTKEQLLNAGILLKSGSIFKRSKINFASIDKSTLTVGDKRTLKEILIKGKSPKVLSEEPSGSYSLVTEDSSSTLTILDAEKFWNTNNRILVVQIK